VRKNLGVLCIISSCFFGLISCSSLAGSNGHDGLATVDCMQERKSQEEIADLLGTIQLISDVFVLISNDGNSRCFTCNLPESYKKEGIRIKYSIIVKEIFPTERLIATPALLTKIETLK
jgi:hypothetical protein